VAPMVVPKLINIRIVVAGAVTIPVSSMVWILLVQVLAFAGVWMH
jgi:hypothetical protein